MRKAANRGDISVLVVRYISRVDPSPLASLRKSFEAVALPGRIMFHSLSAMAQADLLLKSGLNGDVL